MRITTLALYSGWAFLILSWITILTSHDLIWMFFDGAAFGIFTLSLICNYYEKNINEQYQYNGRKK